MALLHEELEARLQKLKHEYEAEVTKVQESQSLLAEKDQAVKELATAKEALKAAQKKHDEIVAQIDRVFGKKSRKASMQNDAKSAGTRSSGKKDIVLAALKEVSLEGLSVAELEAKTGEKNLGVWFATTGKKVAGVERVGRVICILHACGECSEPRGDRGSRPLNVPASPCARESKFFILRWVFYITLTSRLASSNQRSIRNFNLIQAKF